MENLSGCPSRVDYNALNETQPCFKMPIPILQLCTKSQHHITFSHSALLPGQPYCLSVFCAKGSQQSSADCKRERENVAIVESEIGMEAQFRTMQMTCCLTGYLVGTDEKKGGVLSLSIRKCIKMIYAIIHSLLFFFLHRCEKSNSVSSHLR